MHPHLRKVSQVSKKDLLGFLVRCQLELVAAWLTTSVAFGMGWQACFVF